MLKGFYRDILRKPNNKIVYDSGWQKNQIVNQCHQLIAMLMQGPKQINNTPIAPFGIYCMRVGKGIDDWNPEIPRQEPIENLKLPYDQDIIIPGNPPNKIEQSDSKLTITVTLPEEFPAGTYPLREFGLFGRSGRKDDDNEDQLFMINYVKHYLIEKEPSVELIRTIVLEFST